MSETISKASVCEILADIYPTDGEKVVAVKEVDKAYEAIQQLPSAQPQRKKGKWINANDGKWNTVEVLKCSVCGEMDNRMYRTDNFCPNCGADMRGESDESD